MHAAEQIVIFGVFSLVLGAMLRHLLRRSSIPYTVILLLAGLAIGAAARAGWLGALPINDAVGAAATIDPHVILLIFLPTLIFESAFSMDIHVFRRSLWQVLLLAIPGLLLATAGAALLARWLLPGAWGWPAALMFGALVSATDPVAVVALLKELGVSKRLSTLVEGESLFNDGTAIVIFLLFFGLVAEGGSASLGPTISSFLVTAVGGTILGFALGAALLFWLRRVYNDALVEITLTVVMAYLTYYAAEHLHVSGVLAVVALGLCVAGAGRTRISPDVHEFLHHFWELCAYVANTVIFILVGIVVASTFPSTPDMSGWLRLIGLFVGLQVVRMLTVGTLLPLLRKSGYGLSWGEAVILSWSGLRGAVGLALALVVAADGRIAPEIAGPTLHYAAGIVVLSLLINGTTIRPLLSLLGMRNITAGEARLRRQAAEQLEAMTSRERQVLREDRFLGGADWGRVQTWSPTLPEYTDEAPTDTGNEALRRLLELEKRSCWNQYRLGRLGPAAVVRLIEYVDVALDRLRSGDTSLDHWQPWSMPAWVSLLLRVPILPSLTRKLAARRISLTYDMARGAVIAQDELIRHLDKLAADESERRRLAAVCGQRRRAALTALRSIHDHYPEIAVTVETGCARRMMLNGERRAIASLSKDGILDDGAARAWTLEIEQSLKQVWDSEDAAIPSLTDMLWHVEWLRELPNDTFESVREICRERIFAVGEDLVTENERDGRIIVLVRGTVAVVKGPTNVHLDSLGPGAVIGEIGALTGAERTATVRAETTVAAGIIEQSSLQALLSHAPKLNHALWRTAALRRAENLLRNRRPWSTWSIEDLRRRLLQSELIDWDPKTTPPEADAILITGEAITRDGQTHTAPELIRPDHLQPTAACRLLTCPNLRERATH